MPPMRILITGITGFLGWRLARTFAAGNTVFGTCREIFPGIPAGVTPLRLDLREPERIPGVVAAAAAELIIHTAAIISPAACLRDPETARLVNSSATAALARAAAAAGARLLYTSTDRVFDGRRSPCREIDPPSPLGVYGRSKLEGENAVLNADAGNLVLRLPLMYGAPSPRHAPFTGWMLQAWREGKPLRLFLDQYRTPALVDDVTEAIRRLAAKGAPGGIYHLGGGDRVNRAEFGYALAAIFGLDPGLIRPVLMAEEEVTPPTPFDVSLDSDKLERTTGFRLRGIHPGLREFFRQFGLKPEA